MIRDLMANHAHDAAPRGIVECAVATADRAERQSDPLSTVAASSAFDGEALNATLLPSLAHATS